MMNLFIYYYRKIRKAYYFKKKLQNSRYRMQPVVQRGEAEFISTHICLHFHKISLQVYDKSMITMSALRDEKLMVNDRTIWIF